MSLRQIKPRRKVTRKVAFGKDPGENEPCVLDTTRHRFRDEVVVLDHLKGAHGVEEVEPHLVSTRNLKDWSSPERERAMVQKSLSPIGSAIKTRGTCQVQHARSRSHSRPKGAALFAATASPRRRRRGR